MKRAISGALLILTLFLVPIPARADDTPRVFLDGHEINFDVPPIIIDGRVMVPLGKIAEALSLPVKWDAETMTASMYTDNCCTVGCYGAWIQAKEVILDVPPTIIDGRILVPLKFMAQVAKCSIDYDAAANKVDIVSTGGTSGMQLDNNIWIYYLTSNYFTAGSNDPAGNAKLVRQKPDGSEKKIIGEGKYHFYKLYLQNDNVYALDVERNVFLITNEGDLSFITKINSVDQFRIKGNNFYYLVPTEEYSKDGSCRLVNLDLSTKHTTDIVNITGCYNLFDFEVFENWIYYIENDCLYKIKNDGNSRQLLTSGLSIASGPNQLKIIDCEIYYEKNEGLHKLKLDGTGERVVANVSCDLNCITPQWLYCKYLDNICKANGNDVITLCTEKGANLAAVKNNWIYYTKWDSNCMLYAVKTDGSSKMKITNYYVDNVIITSDK